MHHVGICACVATAGRDALSREELDAIMAEVQQILQEYGQAGPASQGKSASVFPLVFFIRAGGWRDNVYDKRSKGQKSNSHARPESPYVRRAPLLPPNSSNNELRLILIFATIKLPNKVGLYLIWRVIANTNI